MTSAAGIPCRSNSQCRNGIQYRTSKPTSPSQGPIADPAVRGADRVQRLADQLLGAAGDRRVDELWMVGRHEAPIWRPGRAATSVHAAARPAGRRPPSSSAPAGRAPRGARACPRLLAVTVAVRPSRPSSSIPSATSWRCVPVEPVRAREALDEVAHLARRRLRPARRARSSWATCSSRFSRDVEQAAVLPAQVVEVERSLLSARELRVEHRQHRLPDDPGLDQAAGVDPDDARAVGERVEVAGTRLACVRLLALARPDRGVRARRGRRRATGRRSAGAGGSGRRSRGAGADRGQPAADEARPRPAR